MIKQVQQKWFATAAIAQDQELTRYVKPAHQKPDVRPTAMIQPALTMRPSISEDYELVIRQKPVTAKMFVGKEKDRKPIDPPPVVQLRVSESVDSSQNYLQNPYFFVTSHLVNVDEARPQATAEALGHGLAGTLVSSLHRLKDTDNSEGGFFVYGDLSVKVEGAFKLQFSLFETRGDEAVYIKSITSGPFNVYAPKNWPGMAESTFLTRSFSEQGVRLRLRKEPRFRLGVRGPASDDYEPRHYRTGKRPSSPEPQAFQPYHQDPQSGPHQHPGEYPARLQQYANAQPSLAPSYSKKRGLSQVDYPASHAPHGDEGYFKRTRTDPDPIVPSYATQQYPLSLEYAGKWYPDTSPAAAFSSFPQQSPQAYGGSFTSSPSSMTPRDQGPYLVPRRADAQFPSLTSSYDSTATRTSQRSPTTGFGFSAPLQPSLQQYNVPPQPQHFAPQSSQPNPASRTTISIPMYPMPLESEQIPLPSRPGNVPSSEMLPPVFGRGTLQGIGMSSSGLTALPSMGEDPRYTRNYTFDFKQRDDGANR